MQILPSTAITAVPAAEQPHQIVHNFEQPSENKHVKKAGSATDPLWYKDAIIYELHVRSFQDSNGDGIGDFPGLISRLDYLQDLGVTCLWLLPFFPSPLRRSEEHTSELQSPC